MLPTGELLSIWNTLFSGLESAVGDTQAAGAAINSSLVSIGYSLFGALSALPPIPTSFPSLPSL